MRRSLILAGLALSAIPLAYGQEAGDLRKQLEELKQEYQQKIADLESRLSALEKKTPPPPVAGQTLPEAVKSAILSPEQVTDLEQGQLASAPTYDQLRDAETKITNLEQQAKAFEFHGYLRS